MSAPFELLQEKDHRTAFVLRAPVFGPAPVGTTPPFLGMVCSTIRVHDLMQSLRERGYMNGIAVSIADLGPVHALAAGADGRQDERGPKGLPLVALSGVPLTSATRHDVSLQVHDRRWRLSFFPAKDFLSPSERRLPMLAAMAGALLSVLLAALVVLLAPACAGPGAGASV